MTEVIDMKTARITTAGVATLAGVFVLQLASAQQLGIQRSEVLRNDLGVPGREVIQVLVDFAAGAFFPGTVIRVRKSPTSSRASWNIGWTASRP
jgi:hypothetical protein